MAAFIAVTTTIDPEGGLYRKPLISVYANYVAVLERLDLSCALVTPAHSRRSIRRLVAASSGLVLTGGEDIEPSRYGEEAHPELRLVNPGRDAMEYHALDAALFCGMPVLGLCRGHQLVNVYFGGTLYQDIVTDIPGEVSHRQTGEWGEHHHDARVRPGTLLAETLRESEIAINSYHHQAIKDVAPPLRVSAVARDGLIEAVEHETHPWLVGVQWHPERHEAIAPGSDPNIRVFEAFRHAVLDFRADRRARRRRRGRAA